MQTVLERTEEKEKTFRAPKRKPVYDAVKRVFDLLLATLALVLLSPLFLVIAILIKKEDKGPAFYSQIRLTKGGKEFRMYKFRSMFVGADKRLEELMAKNEMKGPAFKIADDPRITKIGHFIRRTSIDELPQLVNVIKGQMSIIGPRPPLPREVEQYTPYQMHRLDVKTGLACLHECRGRSDCHDFDQWVEEDLEYIRNRGVLMDLKIIFMTIKVVITGEGAV